MSLQSLIVKGGRPFTSNNRRKCQMRRVETSFRMLSEHRSEENLPLVLVPKVEGRIAVAIASTAAGAHVFPRLLCG